MNGLSGTKPTIGFTIPIIKTATVSDVAYFTLYAPYGGDVVAAVNYGATLLTRA